MTTGITARKTATSLQVVGAPDDVLPVRIEPGRRVPAKHHVVRALAHALLLVAAICATPHAQILAQTASCWPQDSTLNRYHEYFCAVDAPPGSVITGRQLMVALAEIEPVPAYMVANAGGDQNRGGIRRRFQRVEEYGLPIVSGLTAGDVIQINEPWLRAVMSLLPVIVPRVRSWIGAATPPEWTAPPILVPEGDIPLDSHGTASVTLYTRKEGGVRRVILGVQAPPAALQSPTDFMQSPNVRRFQFASWYTLLVEAQARTADQRQWWRQYELAWREADAEMGPPDPSPVFLAEALE